MPVVHCDVHGFPGVHFVYVAMAVNTYQLTRDSISELQEEIYRITYTLTAACRIRAVKATKYTLGWCFETSMTICKRRDARGIRER